MKENPRLLYATGSGPTRAISPRQLPTDHDYAVSTREYQIDQSSHKLPRPLRALPSNNFNNNSKTHECIADLTRSLHIRAVPRKLYPRMLRRHYVCRRSCCLTLQRLVGLDNHIYNQKFFILHLLVSSL